VPHLKPEAAREAAAPAPKAAPAAVPPPAQAKRQAAGKPAPPAYDPLKPRLRPTGAVPDRQASEREIRKLKARIAELERQIAEKEHAVRDLEHLMATPGFYDDRAHADRAVGDRQRLLDEVAGLMAEWEDLQTSAEDRAGSGSAHR
jgi:uncharacterized coiled-coil protein SlyX